MRIYYVTFEYSFENKTFPDIIVINCNAGRI